MVVRLSIPEVFKLTSENVHSLGLEKKSEIREYDRWIFSQFDHVLDGRVLDVACGKSELVNPILKQADSYVGIDYSGELIDRSRERYNECPGASFHCMDLESEDFDEFVENHSFDTVLALNILEHIEQDKKIVNQLSSLLESGGHLVVQVPAHDVLYGSNDRAVGHVRRYSRERLKSLLDRDDFRLDSLHPMNMLGVVPWWIQGTLLAQEKDYFSSLSPWQITLHRWLVRIFRRFESYIKPPVGISYFAITQKTGRRQGSSIN